MASTIPGRQFDEHGNLHQWWTPADEKKFNLRARRIVEQFNEYVAVENLHVNGAATEGENIADLGGLTLGWDAFTKTDEYKRGVKIGGLTPAQRYFIGWALGWMTQMRPEALAVRVKSDVHAPSSLRVIGPATNLVPFYRGVWCPARGQDVPGGFRPGPHLVARQMARFVSRFRVYRKAGTLGWTVPPVRTL